MHHTHRANTISIRTLLPLLLFRSTVWHSLAGSLLKNPAAAPVARLSLTRDATERAQALKAV